MKVVIGDPETGKTYQLELDEAKRASLYGKKIGDTFDGSLIGLGGYEFVITGGSDDSGFPMRKDVHGTQKKKVMLASPPGFHPRRKGERRKKTVRGNTVSEAIVQLNVKVVKKGSTALDELIGKD
jgi:small subunit ribosomal protein S6e